ncbi:MAG: FG-GAP-like repeat-containing protein [Chthoniobacteraceae bacterium]
MPGATDSATLGLNAVGVSATTTLPGNHTVGTLIHNVGSGGASNSILNISTGVTLTVLTNFTWRGGVENGAGALTVAPGGTFSFPGTSGQGSTLTARTLNLQGTSTFSNASNETISFVGGATINNSGNLEIRHQLTLNQSVGETGFFNNLAGGTVRGTTASTSLITGTAVASTNAGIVRAELGLLQFSGGLTQTAGSSQMAGGSLSVPSGLQLNGGEVTGVGAFGGDINNNGGVVRPGGTGATGMLTTNATYRQFAGGTIELEVAGAGAGQFDVFAPAGLAVLGGTLNAPLLGGFTPGTTDTFRVLDPGSIVSGTFATVNSPLIAQYSTGDVTLIVPGGPLTFIWDGGAGADQSWFNPINWNLDSGVPGAIDTAILQTAQTISLPSDTSVGTFQQSNGTFTSGAGVTFTVLNSFDWTGGTQSGSGTTISSGTLTLSGAGVKTLTTRSFINNGTANLSGGNFTTTNATVTNNGVFNATDNADVTGSGSGGFANSASGTLNKTGAGTTTQFYQFTNAGTLNATSGTVDINSGFTQTAGSTVLGGGSITGAFGFNFQGGELRGTGSIGAGIINNTGATVRPGGTGAAGTITITGGYTQGNGGRVAVEIGGTGAGQFDVLAVTGNAIIDGAMDVSLLGGFTPASIDTFRVLTGGSRSGQFQIVNGPLVGQYNATNVTLISTPGMFVWDAGAGVDTSWFNPANWSPDGVPGATDSATLNINATATLPSSTSVGTWIHGGTSAATLTIPTGMTLTVLNNFTWTGGTENGPGTLTVASGATFNYSSGSPTFLTARTLNLEGNSLITATQTLTLASGATINNTGTLEIQTGLSIGGAGTGTFNNLTGATLRKTVGGTVIFGNNVAFTNAGTVRAEVGTIGVNGGYTQTAGSSQMFGGILNIFPVLALQGGELAGVGAFSGTINNTGGVVRPGGVGVIGTLTTNGDYFQSAGGTLETEIAGTGAGQFDVFAPGGNATLNGTLNAPLLGGFTPGVGNTFLVLDPGISVSGTFATVNSPLTAQYNASDVTLLAPAGPLTFVWDNSAGTGDWFNPLNWNLDSGVPGAADTAILNIASTINLTGNASVGTFQQSAGTFSGAGAFTVLTSFAWTGGTQSGSGITNANGGLTLSGGTHTLNTRTLNNLAAATWTAGALDLLNGATINNQVGATFTTNFDGAILQFSSVTFNNAGTFTKSGGTGSTSSAAVFNNTGTVNINSGTLALQSGGADSGAFNLGAGSTLNFAGGTHTLGAAATITDTPTSTLIASNGTAIIASAVTLAGTTSVAGGTLTFNNTANLASLNLSSGTLNGNGTVNVSAAINWTGGAMTGSGITNANGGLTLSGGTHTLDSRTLSNVGAATWSAGSLNLLNGATINNQIGATFTTNFDGSITQFNPVTFNNAGTFTKNGGTGITSSAAIFNNTGTVNINSGTLSFSNFTQTAGTTSLAGGNLGGGITFAFQSGELRGAGTITGNVNNSGATVRPGGTGAAGTLAITGAYTQGAGGTLAAELGGTSPGEFDVLSAGTATLGGTLNLANLAGFTPAGGDMFRVVQSGNNPGTFATLSGATAGISQAADATGLVLTAAVVAIETDVSLSGGNLIVTDINGGVSNDNLTITLVGANVRVSDPGNLLMAGAGATQIDPNTVEVPLASITGNIQVNTLGGDDTLTLALAGGDFIVASGLNYAAGANGGAGDALVITGDVQGTVSYGFTNATDGTLGMSAFGTVTVTGLENTTNSGTATNVLFNLPASASAITLGDDGTTGNGLTRLGGTTVWSVDFPNPSNALTIIRGNAADTLTVNALPDLNASLNLASVVNPLAALTFAGAVTLGANKSLTSATSGTTTFSAAFITSGTGSISLTAGDLVLGGGAGSLVGSGVLQLLPATAASTIGVGATATGAFNLDPTDLAALANGFTSITIGRDTTGTGTVDINASTFADNVSVFGGEIVVTGLDAGANDVTLTTTNGPIQNGGDISTDVTGGNVVLIKRGFAATPDFFAIGGNGGSSAALSVDATTVNATVDRGSVAIDAVGTGGVSMSLLHTNNFGTGNIFAGSSTEDVTITDAQITGDGFMQLTAVGHNLSATNLMSGGAFFAGDFTLTTTTSGNVTLGAATNGKGAVNVTSAGNAVINGPINATASGTWTAGGSITGAGAVTLTGTSDFAVTASGAINLSGAITVPGTTTLAAGAMSDITLTNAGTSLAAVNISGGTLRLAGPLAATSVAIAGGASLAGAGTIGGSVSSSGTVRPGGTGATGTLTINGSYTQDAGGTLEVEVGGTAAGEFDVFDVNGTAMLGGTLSATLLGGFTPPAGTPYPVLTYSSASGSFTTVSTPPELTAVQGASALVLVPPVSAFVVTTTLDVVDAADGLTSLREAILAANANSGFDTITFNILGGGVRTISPSSTLPVIMEAVLIDGYTQPGASLNTLATGTDAVLTIALDGSLAGSGTDGLTLGAGSSSSIVRGLDIHGFSGNGINVASDGNAITGNFIGASESANALAGARVTGTANVIGGGGIAERNVIAFNSGDGVSVVTGRGNVILGNSIHSNTGPGIDLGDDGITANDADDSDGGANDSLNFPVITSAAPNPGGSADVSGSVTTAINGAVRIEFFLADAGGQGMTFLGLTDVVSVAGVATNFSVSLTGPVNAGEKIVATTSDLSVGGAGTSEFSSAATVIPPALISIGDVAIVEGNSGTKQLVFTLTLDQAVPATVTVDFDTADFSTDARAAMAGVDYLPVVSGLVTFAPNELSKTISITITGDTAGEPVERFNVVLSNATNAGIGDGTGTGAIIDDDHHTFAVSEGSGNKLRVFTASASGAVLIQTIEAFTVGFKGGVRVAVGDVTGDGVDDFIAGAGLGGRAKVRVFDGLTFAPVPGVLGEFSAFGTSYRGGVFVATGDVNGDGFSDVIVTPSAGSSNRVNIFSGADGSLLNSFRAFGKGTGGVRVAAGDVNGDGLADIIAGTGVGSSVRVFDAMTGLVLQGDGHEFRAFGKSYRGGVYVAAGDLNADGVADIIVGAGSGTPNVRTYFQEIAGTVPKTFAAYAGGALRGVRVAALDIDGDGVADIITSKGRKGDSSVRAFDGASTAAVFGLRPFGNQLDSLYVG